MGELLANTLAVRNVNVVVLDIKPIQTENCVLLTLFRESNTHRHLLQIIISRTTNVMFLSGKKSKQFLRRLSRRSIHYFKTCPNFTIVP